MELYQKKYKSFDERYRAWRKNFFIVGFLDPELH